MLLALVIWTQISCSRRVDTHTRRFIATHLSDILVLQLLDYKGLYEYIHQLNEPALILLGIVSMPAGDKAPTSWLIQHCCGPSDVNKAR